MTLELIDKTTELTAQFRQFFGHKKKLTALENVAGFVPFKHTDYLGLIKRCLASGFLLGQEADFLNHMIETYFTKNNFLDWSHKTRWLKGEMDRLNGRICLSKPIQGQLFDLSKLDRPRQPYVPVELMAVKSRGLQRRAG